ncbi:MAG: low molecular weight phosphotyrosine protein phosphatase [Burkholderiales bacterium]|nr:low molecular weight phosphotyrosine protein phosphatase [Burkholderiales bacterium]
MPMPSKTAILFVCMGNICRSPTAEGVLRTKAQAAGVDSHLLIDSAGTHAYHVGEAPDPRSQQFALQRGIDLSMQRARQVREQDFERFDLLLAMDKRNLALLQAACPVAHKHKLGLLMEYAQHSDVDEVPDPYYGGERGFDQVLDYIEDAADGLLLALQRSS